MSRVAPFGLLLPVFALISSVLFLGEPLTATLIAGGLASIAGVAITQSAPRRPERTSGFLQVQRRPNKPIDLIRGRIREGRTLIEHKYHA